MKGLVKNSIILIILLFACGAATTAQVNPVREQGEVFKHRAETPGENLDFSGLVVVENGMYGLVFKDERLSSAVTNRVERFFDHGHPGYTELKTYRLKIERRGNRWYIDENEL